MRDRLMQIPIRSASARQSHDRVLSGTTRVGIDNAQAAVAHYLRPGTLLLSRLPPLALYVHFPWCIRKCPYCDFNSHEAVGGTSAIPQAAYLAALRADLEASLPLIWGRQVVSVFIGGGTPSLLTAVGVEQLLSDLRSLLPLAPDVEVTLEANPGTFEVQRFSAYRGAGINRLSIGVQSFEPQQLRNLGRVHDREQAIAAVKHAAAYFEEFNIDLMYALPGQSIEQARIDLRQALAFSPTHLSLYQLTVEPNTLFAKFPPSLPDEDTSAAIHEMVEDNVVAAGYRHYEVSAYARPGHPSTHNLNYWHFGDYLGIGAGAASKLSFPHRIVRQTRWRNPEAYLKSAATSSFIASSSEVARADLPFEFMLNALRLNEGFATALFTERTGLPTNAISAPLQRAEQLGLITCDRDRIVPTLRGRRFLTDLQCLFLPAAATAQRASRQDQATPPGA